MSGPIKLPIVIAEQSDAWGIWELRDHENGHVAFVADRIKAQQIAAALNGSAELQILRDRIEALEGEIDGLQDLVT